MTYDKIKYNNEFNKNAYDRMSVNLPKGKKQIVLEHCKQKGFSSFNAYVNDLIQKDMEENEL